jgi:hypothetical protein
LEVEVDDDAFVAASLGKDQAGEGKVGLRGGVPEREGSQGERKG